MLTRFMRVLMLSATVLTVGSALVAGSAPRAFAAQQSTVRMTADNLLGRQAVAVSVIAKTYTALPQQARGKSMPFVKSLIDLSTAYRDVATASKARDNKKMGAALPKVATSLAKLNSAYQMSGLRDPKIKSSIKSLDGLWKNYLKVVNVGKPPHSAAKAHAASRKVNALRRAMLRPAGHHKADRREAARRAQLASLLRQAQMASRQADRLWYANMLMAEAYGYYAGLYEYYSAYDPAYARDYGESWESISRETEYFYSESVSSYEEYSWSSYEQTIEVEQSYDFGMTETEISSVETEFETSGSAISQETVDLYEHSDEHAALEGIETRVDDDESLSSDTGAGNDENLSGDEDTSDDSSGDDIGLSGDEDTGEDQGVSGDDGSGENACDGDSSSVECASSDEQGSQDDVSGDDGSGDDEGLSGDEDTGDDEGVSDDASSGENACDGDSSSEECASSDEQGSSDDVSGDDGSGDDEGLSGDEDAGDDESMTGDDSSGDDQSASDGEGSGDDEATSGDDGSGGNACDGENASEECASSDEQGSSDDVSGDESGGSEDYSGGDDSSGGEDYSGGEDSGGGEDYSGGDDSGGGEDYSGGDDSGGEE